MADWKALREELADALASHYPGHVDDDELIKRARAALAGEAVGEGPTDEELLELMPQGFRDDLALVSRMAAHGAGPEVQPGLFRVTLNTGALDYARAVWDRAHYGYHPAALAAEPVGEPAPPAEGELSDEDLGEPLGDLIDKWCQEGMQVKPYGTSFPLAHYVASRAYQYGLSKGHQPAPPAEGEVGELVAWLRETAASLQEGGIQTPRLTRAADLLEQCRPAPVPVAIPGEEYHEDMGAVTWWRFPVDEPPWVGTPNDSDWPGYHTHFTPAPPEPANALPLPAGEVEP